VRGCAKANGASSKCVGMHNFLCVRTKMYRITFFASFLVRSDYTNSAPPPSLGWEFWQAPGTKTRVYVLELNGGLKFRTDRIALDPRICKTSTATI